MEPEPNSGSVLQHAEACRGFNPEEWQQHLTSLNPLNEIVLGYTAIYNNNNNFIYIAT